MKRIQRIFLPVCCLAILIFFSCLCLKDLFGDVALDQMLWHVKNAELLAQGHTDELKILRYIFTAILYMALCCGLFLHDRKIAAWIHRALVKLASRLSLSLSLWHSARPARGGTMRMPCFARLSGTLCPGSVEHGENAALPGKC